MRFYGPNDLQFKQYLEEVKKPSDVRMTYLKMLLEYWFEHRQKLKKRSKIHKMILKREEGEEQEK